MSTQFLLKYAIPVIDSVTAKQVTGSKNADRKETGTSEVGK